MLKTETDIDYNGASGPVSLDAAGDPASAAFGVYRYDAANRYSWTSVRVTVGFRRLHATKRHIRCFERAVGNDS